MNQCVCKVKILKEAGFEESMMAISMNKKMYSRDMYPVSMRLFNDDNGHNKFLEMIGVWIDYTLPRSIHSELDTYRIGTSKSSESTMHRLIEDALYASIDVDFILEKVKNEFDASLKDTSSFPIISCAKYINAIKNEGEACKELVKSMYDKDISPVKILNAEELANWFNKFFDKELPLSKVEDFKTILNASYEVNLSKFYAMFEDGKNSVSKETIFKIAEIAFDQNMSRREKLHVLKRLVPESFLQRRILFTNYKTLRHIISQRYNHTMFHWHIFVTEIIRQIEHPEYFADIFEKDPNKYSLEDIKNGALLEL